MKITKLIGASNDQERTALRELLAICERGGSYSAELLGRIPSGRVEVHVTSNANNNMLAVIVIENGVVTFHPPDALQPGTTH